MAVRVKKVPYLEISPEKFRPQDGSGCCSGVCLTPTGDHTAAILKAPTDSSSQSANLPVLVSAENSLCLCQAKLEKYCQCEMKPTKAVITEMMEEKAHEGISGEEKVVSRVCDCLGYETKKTCYCPPTGNGTFGESELELYQFWPMRRPVPQK